MKFDYEELNVGLMTHSGSSILKGMSSEMPILDMFVREAIQNSIDARLENVTSVREAINCGDFDFKKLVDYYPEIRTKLTFTKHDNRQFVSIRDYSTTGLEGPIRLSEYKNSKSEDWGKFLNLVRNVGKSNKTNDAGGSWGYGKTTYFRLGVGLVIYYTRIKDHDTNTYIERLMTCLVENENNSTGLLYEQQKDNHTGIAWWGKKDGDELVPVTNHDEIEEFLKIFNIKPYEYEETGTCIIIPFINEKELLSETIPANIDEVPHWCQSIEDYLEISCQRWYPTRYGNENANPNVILFINENPKFSPSMYPVFDIYQKMYNMYLNNISSKDNIESFNVNLLSIFNKGKIAGTLFYTYLSKEDLKMEEFGNYPSPFLQITNRSDENDSRVIVAFCRKPGMILKYDISEGWTNGIINSDPEKYLICLFIPNSSNTMSLVYKENNDVTVIKEITLEDYLRASERAEHSDWADNLEYTFPDGKKANTSKLRIVEKIQRNIKNEFAKRVKVTKEKNITNVGTALNQKLAAMFLPKKGFGKKAVAAIKPPTEPSHSKRVSKTKFEFGGFKIADNGQFVKDFKIQLKHGDNSIEMKFAVGIEGQSFIPAEAWFLESFPVNTKCIEITSIKSSNGEELINHQFLTSSMYSNINFEWLSLDNKINYGFKLLIDKDNVFEIQGKIYYEIIDQSYSIIIIKRSSANNE